MLKDLVKKYSTLHIAGREYQVRYSLNALLCLEMTYKPLAEILQTDWQNWSIEDILQLCHAAMCDRACNKKAVINRKFQIVKPTLDELGTMIDVQDFAMLKLEIITAIADSMPDTQPTEEQSARAADESHQRAIFVDILGRPESEFWESTNREINQRINAYLEAKGLKDTPTQIQMFDE